MRAESTSSEADNRLELHQLIERQRGDVFQLYHFSRVLSRNDSILRQVVERNSRIERVCKIKNAGKQMALFQSIQEIEILKHLNHPNIVQIVEYFSDTRFLYLMLEQVPGKTIYDLSCEDFLHNLEVVIEVVRQILIALRFCHQQGYAHKAINPEHVMVVRLSKPNNLLVKLVGFGSAHKMGAPTPSPLHHTVFTAPEAHSEHEADKQDIWGTGIMFLELLSGEKNF